MTAPLLRDNGYWLLSNWECWHITCYHKFHVNSMRLNESDTNTLKSNECIVQYSSTNNMYTNFDSWLLNASNCPFRNAIVKMPNCNWNDFLCTFNLYVHCIMKMTVYRYNEMKATQLHLWLRIRICHPVAMLHNLQTLRYKSYYILPQMTPISLHIIYTHIFWDYF